MLSLILKFILLNSIGYLNLFNYLLKHLPSSPACPSFKLRSLRFRSAIFNLNGLAFKGSKFPHPGHSSDGKEIAALYYFYFNL